MTSITTTSKVSNAMSIVLRESKYIKESHSILKSKDSYKIYSTRLYETILNVLGDNPETSCGFWKLRSLEHQHESGDCLVTHIFALEDDFKNGLKSKNSLDCSFNIMFVGSILDGVIEMEEVYPVECIEGVWVPVEEFKWMD